MWYVVVRGCTCGGEVEHVTISRGYEVKADAYDRAAAADRSWPKDKCTGKVEVEER